MTSDAASASDSSDVLPHEIEALRALLTKVTVNTSSSRQKTFFSIGGRSHWENPASDVLAFFLNPHEEHGFGSLFLQAFFRCMGVDTARLDLDTHVQVRTEERLLTDERIDLVLRAPGWVLAIENKIYHWAANDFAAYADHVHRLADANQQVHLALLAPDLMAAKGGWKPITYREFCAALQTAFNQSFPKPSSSKWQVFAEEFVAHLQTLLYPVRMNLDPAQLALVESHLPQITTLKRYAAAYDEFLAKELQTRLAQVLPGFPPFDFKLEHWAWVCDSQRGEKWRLAFLTPAHDHLGNAQKKFIAGACLQRGASDTLFQRARRDLVGLTNFYDRGEWWESTHEDREAAVKALCETALKLFGSDQVQVST